MAFDTVGKLHVAYETKQVSERFTKREFVVEIADGKYPQFVLFQLTGDRCSLLDNHKVGDSVRVTFNVRGREWRSPQGETKYFNSLAGVTPGTYYVRVVAVSACGVGSPSNEVAVSVP